jgi:3-oxoacyl-[acyl-carrier protein] reductase
MQPPVVFVTGASRGIGRACALAFARQHAQLVIHARTESALEDTAREVLAAGAPPPLVFGYDIAQPDGGKAAFQQIFRQFGRLDTLVNNAGVMEPAALGMLSATALARTLDTDLAAAILHMQSAARLMTRGGSGAIINMSSIVGRFGFEGQVAYSAAKAGLIGATLAAAKELAAAKVRVNAVAPGLIDTELHSTQSEPALRDALARVRMGRMGTPQDVAALVVFLASDAASYITGQVIGVDGGMSL